MRRTNPSLSWFRKKQKKAMASLAASAITNRIVAYTIVTIGLYGGAILIFLKPGIPPSSRTFSLSFLVGVSIYMAVLLYLAFVKQAAKNFAKLYGKILKTLRPKHYNPAKEAQREKSLDKLLQRASKNSVKNPDC